MLNGRGGDKIDLGGGHVMEFVMAPNLHWPDTMFSFDHATNVMYTCDAFGLHYCSEVRCFNSAISAAQVASHLTHRPPTVLAASAAVWGRELRALQCVCLLGEYVPSLPRRYTVCYGTVIKMDARGVRRAAYD